MARAQGSLEYLIIIAIVLAVSAVVISYSTGILGGGKSSISVTSCKQAAVDCKAAKMLSSTDPCLPCDTACKDSGGVELFDGATFCCNHGLPEMVFANSPGCYGCKDSTDCLSPTPFCLANVCVECRDNTDCPLTGTVCSASHACVPGCTDTKPCPPGQVCCGTDPNKACKIPACTDNPSCAGTDIPKDCYVPTCGGTGCNAVCNPTGAPDTLGSEAGCKSTTIGDPYCGTNAVCTTTTTYACDGAGNCKGTPSTSCPSCGTCGYCEAGVCYDGYDSPTSCAKTTCQWCKCTTGLCIGLEGCSSVSCYTFCKWC